MQKTQSQFDWLVSLGQFGAWVVTSLGAMLNALYLRETLILVLRVVQVFDLQLYRQRGEHGLNLQFGYGISLVDNLMLLVLGCGAIACVILLDVYYRRGRKAGHLWKNVAKVVITEVVMFAVMGAILLYL